MAEVPCPKFEIAFMRIIMPDKYPTIAPKEKLFFM